MNKIKNHIKQYSLLVSWLTKDLYSRYRWKLTWVVISTFIGLSMQTFVVYLCYRYAKALESNEVFSLMGREFIPRTSFALLVAVASAIMIMKIVSALILVNGKKTGLQLARNYTDYCSTRTYVLVSSVSTIPNDKNGDVVSMREISKMARRNSLYAGMVVRVLTFSLISIGTTIIAGVSLVVIDASLTLIVLFILFVTAIFFYKKSLKAAETRVLLSQLAPGMTLEHKILKNRLNFGPVPLNYQDIGVQEIFNNGISKKFSTAYVNQRLVLEESNVLAQIVIGLSIFLIIVVQGNATMTQGGNWSALLIYLVAFNFFATGFAKTAQLLTSVNRFYPSVNEYSKFVLSISEQLENEKENANKFSSESELVIGTEHGGVKVNKGDLVAYVSSTSVDNIQLSILHKELYFTHNGSKERYIKKPWLVSTKHSMVKTSLREALLLPDTMSLSDVKSEIKEIDIEANFKGFPADFDKILLDKDMDRINQNLLILLLIISGRHHNNEVIIIDEIGLRSFSEQAIKNIFSYLDEKIVIISFSSNMPNALGHYNEKHAFFADVDKIVGSLDMKLANSDDINELLDSIKSDFDSETTKKELIDDDLDEEY